MKHGRARVALLAWLLPFLLHATVILKNDLLNKQASEFIERIGKELVEKTGVHVYLVATNEAFPEKYNLVAYSKRYEANVSKPYVMMIFAPQATILNDIEQKGRVAIIPSSDKIAAMLDKSEIMDATVDVVASIDKNKPEDKHAIGMVQGISTIADQIAAAKGVTLTQTIKDSRQGLRVLKFLVIIGALIVAWIFLVRPILSRIRHG